MQFVKKLLSRIRNINHNQILGVFFIAAVFYIATATLAYTFINIGYYLNVGFISVRNTIDDAYRNMLEFNGKYPVNKGAYINLNGLMARAMGQHWMNERVKLDNGHLTSLVGKLDVTLSIAQMTKLANFQKENDRHFLFVLAPFQIPKYEDILPVGYADYSNENADNLLKGLRENGVPVLDLRDEMLKDGLSSADVFFITDHHWKPEAGFWAYTKIVEYLTRSGIIENIDPKFTDINEYNVEIYKDIFLGSSGKRTGSYFAGVDDISIITPKFETDISLEIKPRGIFNSGAFADVVFSRRLVKGNYFTTGAYEIYGYDNSNDKIYLNDNAPVDLKFLSIRDSFACATTTFLSLITRECRELDFRYNDMSFYDNEDFISFYSEYEPDVIIVLINAGGTNQINVTYDFFGDLE